MSYRGQLEGLRIVNPWKTPFVLKGRLHLEHLLQVGGFVIAQMGEYKAIKDKRDVKLVCSAYGGILFLGFIAPERGINVHSR